MPDGGIVSTSHLHHQQQHSSHSVVDNSSSFHNNSNSIGINSNNNNNNNNNNTSQQQQQLVVNRSLASLSISNNNNNNNPNESNDQNNNSNANANDGDMHGRRGFLEGNMGQYQHQNGHFHWSHLLRQVVLTPPTVHQDNRNPKQEDNSPLSSHTILPLQISGGSENGQFAFIGQVNKNEIRAWTSVGNLDSGDVILDIAKQQVAGYTQADVLALLYHCLRLNSVTLTVAPQGSLGPELRSYLNTRFQKGSVDHSLQGVIRDNLYLRTVPVTTRTPRPGEIPGVDYTFLSVEEFMELERNGSLLESGVYAGNHYGTPKPWASRAKSINSQLGGSSGVGVDGGTSGSGDQSGGGILPGMHPSSEGKRRRNRSNVEALGAGGGDDEPPSPNPNINRSTTIPAPSTSSGYPSSAVPPPPDELGPLPKNWEMSYTEKGEVYFIDHNTGTSHWLDPRLSRIQKLSLEDCADNELPFGWERIDDPHYGTYYIDHVNRRTQFENPVIQAKKSKSPTNGEDDDDDDETNNTEKLSFNENYKPPLPNSNPPYNSNINSNVPQMIITNTPTNHNNSPITNHNRLSVPRGKTPVEFMSDNQQQHHQQFHHHQQLQQQQQQQHHPYIENSNSNMTPNLNSYVDSHSSNMPSSSSGLRVKSVERDRPSIRFFTRDPSQLVGEFIKTSLVKSSRGLGFTIVGGDDDDGLDEFLQIKSVVHDGAAWRDAKLRTGDVLVRVNSRCVLGYTHHEMVSIFQGISPGEEVELEVCRGYPLPFDPADPNTEIVTTVAVAPASDGDKSFHRNDWVGRPSTPDSLAHSAHSLPELSTNDRTDYGRSNANTNRPASVDLLDASAHSHARSNDNKGLPKYPAMEQSIFLTVNIVKGSAGFGFTIADSVAGQKVKKVLDPTHCGGLEEGDKLIAIDNIDLRGLGHSQVVQVLKEFPLGRGATLTVQRIQSQVVQFNHKLAGVNSNHYSDTRLIPNRPGISPRSKTPTADLGRGPRMRDTLPERPKTPLFLDSSGQMSNGQLGLYNGDIHHQQQDPQMHQPFVPSERYSTSSMGMNSTVQTGNDLSQFPRDWIEMTIDLQRRQEGFGFRIIGGTEEGSQVSVGQVVPRGAADLDGRLQTNDQIIKIDGHNVIGASHRSVVELMAAAANHGRVRLVVRKPVYGATLNPNQVSSPARSPSISMPMHVTLRRQPIEGFGFVIISSASKAGATIGRIVEGSPADRCGQLHVGDRILAVNQIDISQLHHSQVVQLIKDSGLVLTLSVISVGNPNLSQLSPSEHHQSNMMSSDMENHGYDIGTAFISPDNHPMHFSSNNSGSSHPDSLEQVFSVHLTRGNKGFGFSIRGGKEFQNMPLFVLRLAEDGPAALHSSMQVGDQILQINGIGTHEMTHSQAIHIIKNGGLNVHLLLRRGSLPFPFPESFQNFTSGGRFEEEGQSLSSNNDPQQQFIGVPSPMYPQS